MIHGIMVYSISIAIEKQQHMNSSISSRGNWEGTKSKLQRLATISAEQQVHNTKIDCRADSHITEPIRANTERKRLSETMKQHG